MAGAATGATVGTVLWSSTKTTQAEPHTDPGSLLVGRELADATGEPLGAGMNGYAVPEQTSLGIQCRQYARAFIFADPTRAEDPGARICHVTVDTGLMFQSVHLEVIRRLRERFGELYGAQNVLIHATHTHVAPGGTSQHLMVDLVILGFRHGEGYVAIRSAGGQVVAHDSSESTLLTFLKAGSTVTTVLEWDTTGLEPGRYKVTYSGDARGVADGLTSFNGVAIVDLLS